MQRKTLLVLSYIIAATITVFVIWLLGPAKTTAIIKCDLVTTFQL